MDRRYMDRNELLNLLNSHEWRKLEFKEAKSGVPKSSYETVSAFANTEGGHLVFGVRKEDPGVEIVGVLEVDKVQNDFISSLNPPKLSKTIETQEYLFKENGQDIIVFYIPESNRVDKPVYLDGDIRRSFIRKGGCDVRCSPEELKRFLNDAATERFDGQTVDCDAATCFDGSTIKWYRRLYDGRPGNKSYSGLSDLDFLSELGLMIERSGIKMPTRAAILLFGRDGIFRQLLPRPVVDCQRFNLKLDDAPTAQRWIDRVVIDENLFNSWQIMLNWYMKMAEHPFRIDPLTLQREDEPPDYIAFRESAINLLIHQDYADHSRKPEIRHYLDRILFWNPGDAFTDNIDLLEPGQKEVRNPQIVTAFRRIGLSEHAGWGLRDVFTNWQQLGNIPPQINNDKVKKTFELVLLKELLLSEEQLIFQASLGVHLSEQEALAFAYVSRKQDVTLAELKTVTNLGSPEVRKIADRLCIQSLLKPIKEGENYSIADHLRDRFLTQKGTGVAGKEKVREADLFTGQVDKKATDLYTEQVRPLKSLSETQWRIVALCETPRSLAGIMAEIGVGNRGHFKAYHLDPLLKGNVIKMTNPENPRAANQKYVLTETGIQLKISKTKGKS